MIVEIRYQRVPEAPPPQLVVHRPPVTAAVATRRVPAGIVTRTRAVVDALVRRLAAHFAVSVVAPRAGDGPELKDGREHQRDRHHEGHERRPSLGGSAWTGPRRPSRRGAAGGWRARARDLRLFVDPASTRRASGSMTPWGHGTPYPMWPVGVM